MACSLAGCGIQQSDGLGGAGRRCCRTRCAGAPRRCWCATSRLSPPPWRRPCRRSISPPAPPRCRLPPPPPPQTLAELSVRTQLLTCLESVPLSDEALQMRRCHPDMAAEATCAAPPASCAPEAVAGTAQDIKGPRGLHPGQAHLAAPAAVPEAASCGGPGWPRWRAQVELGPPRRTSDCAPGRATGAPLAGARRCRTRRWTSSIVAVEPAAMQHDAWGDGPCSAGCHGVCRLRAPWWLRSRGALRESDACLRRATGPTHAAGGAHGQSAQHGDTAAKGQRRQTAHPAWDRAPAGLPPAGCLTFKCFRRRSMHGGVCLLGKGNSRSCQSPSHPASTAVCQPCGYFLGMEVAILPKFIIYNKICSRHGRR